MRWKVIAGGGGGRAADAPEAASFADRNAAAAWRRRYLDWMESRLPRASTDLFARLPFSDAVALAALVGTGRMTWPEINAALDAMLKLAAADAPDGDWRGHDASLTEDIVERVVEEEIWARYHAQCDEVFADQSGLTDPGPWSREQVWRTERILDRLRCARDRELALVRRRWDARSLAPAESEIRLEQSQAA